MVWHNKSERDQHHAINVVSVDLISSYKEIIIPELHKLLLIISRTYLALIFVCSNDLLIKQIQKDNDILLLTVVLSIWEG